MVSTLLPEIAHEVQDRLTAQHLVAHISAQHDGRFVVQDGGGISWPDGQPMTEKKGSSILITNPFLSQDCLQIKLHGEKKKSPL